MQETSLDSVSERWKNAISHQEITDRVGDLDSQGNAISDSISLFPKQLANFLPDGKYYNIHDEALHDRLQHSNITNHIREEKHEDSKVHYRHDL
jgi:regulator of replication initiation timing